MNTLTKEQRELVQEVLEEIQASVLEINKKLSQVAALASNGNKQ